MPKKSGTTLQRGAAKPASSSTGKQPAAKKASSTSKPKASAKTKTAEAEKPFSFITVRVGRLPGVIQTIALNGGRTVADALEGAALSSNGYEIRVNGAPSDTTTNLTEADTVLLVKKIKGN